MISTIACASFDTLHDFMHQLGLTISDRKLVYPATQAACLGVIVDTIESMVSISQDKLENITNMVNNWAHKTHCNKKVAITTWIFSLCSQVCRTGTLLSKSYAGRLVRRITLTEDFKQNVRWFQKFLPQYNGKSMYNQPY